MSISQISIAYKSLSFKSAKVANISAGKVCLGGLSTKKKAMLIAGSLVKKGLNRSDALRKAWKIAKKSAADRVVQFKNAALTAIKADKNRRLKLAESLRKLAGAGLRFYSYLAKSVLKFGKMSEKQAAKIANAFYQVECIGCL